MIWMTKMENIVMNLAGCNRQIANTIVNTILEEDMIANKERAQVAIDAIKKQIPKKPIPESLADRACPVRDAYIQYDALNDNIEDAPKFCKNCGQALDWKEA